MLFDVTSVEEDRQTLAMETMESGNIGSVENNSGNSSGQTIAQLINQYSIKNYNIFDICGSVHRIDQRNMYFTLWRGFSILLVIFGLCLISYATVIELIEMRRDESDQLAHLGVADMLLDFSVGVQLIITIFAVHHSHRRMDTIVTPVIANAMEESMEGTMTYFRVCTAFFFGGMIFLSIGVFIYDDGDTHLIVINSVIYISYQFASYSMSIWAIVFIRLDACLLKSKLNGLKSLAIHETLTARDINEVYIIYKDLKRSRKLCEGILIGAGLNVVLFVLLCFVFETLKYFQVWILLFICMALCTMGREILQLWYILPIVADVNESYEELCMSLATTVEWRNDDGYGNLSLWVLLQQQPLKYGVFGRNWNRDDIKTNLFSTGVVLFISTVRFLLFSVLASV